MDPLISSSASDETRALRSELSSLRLAVQIMLVSLVVLAGSMALYLFRQVSLLRRQVVSSERIAGQLVTNFNVNLATQAMRFERDLLSFARTNPEFQAQLSRYFGMPTNAPGPALPTTGSTPPPSP